MPKIVILPDKTFSAILIQNEDLKLMFSAGKVLSSPTVVKLPTVPTALVSRMEVANMPACQSKQIVRLSSVPALFLKLNSTSLDLLISYDNQQAALLQRLPLDTPLLTIV